MTKDRREYFDCECGSIDHLMRVDIYQWVDNPTEEHEVDLAFYIQASPYLPWYKRIVAAVKYIFNSDGNEWYSSTLMRHKDVPRLKAIIKDYETRIKDLK